MKSEPQFSIIFAGMRVDPLPQVSEQKKVFNLSA
jgi:hypothetical protein